ncbi:MAG: flagellar hook-associated protein FlgK, partial [Leptolinea sp.]
MTGFSGIQVALQALLAQQTALEITQNNVANANTKGYHRQEAIMKAGFPVRSMAFTSSAGQQNIGTGVYVDRIQRFSLEFYDTRYRSQMGENSKFNMMTSMLTEVEISLADTSSDGIAQRMNEFFNGWQTVATDPDIGALRDDLLERTQSMTEAFNNRALRLIQIQQDQDLALTQRVDDINNITKQIGELNAEIGRSQGAKTQPNAQLDERDRLLDQLSQLIGITSHVQDNGQVIVSLQGHAMVLGN